MHKNKANTSNPIVAVIVVAGGAGRRVGGDRAKQFQLLSGRDLIDWSVSACAASPQVSRTVVVAPAAVLAEVRERFAGDPRVSIVGGGAERTDSVRAGLEVLRASQPDVVLIHDAARPGITPEIISDLVAALETSDAAAPALPIADAIKRSTDGGFVSVDREGLHRVQTPQAFRFDIIMAAYDKAAGSAVDDLALLPASATVRLVDGDIRLQKVTYPGDMEQIAKVLLEQDIRVGTGFDVHAFADGDHVTLCGQRIPYSRSLAGHSDADVGWHALTDAILGALALGDIGHHFPPSEPKWKGVASEVFLSHAVKLARDRGYRISNADITLVCEAPKIGPNRQQMRERTAAVLGVPIERVSVKATTTEKLGFTGRQEGIAAQAAVTLSGHVPNV